ncbi:hypothetical protein D8B26_007307 [Coccidioides posadasii str. Silveira]|uniref:Uncharacterized protein n=1 Tax=Coccidioides posadasii (strain RMSCC 757 / Silveira) TaxID=443226 RepID=E9D3E4_COCPS|nr:conserved hypothetical protein [Coccidioides posadasii str. Silveira]QVM12689.1 hypothetical protein D8B26_007307 [Coccidioides posadasii str. Silveira]
MRSDMVPVVGDIAPGRLLKLSANNQDSPGGVIFGEMAEKNNSGKSKHEWNEQFMIKETKILTKVLSKIFKALRVRDGSSIKGERASSRSQWKAMFDENDLILRQYMGKWSSSDKIRKKSVRSCGDKALAMPLNMYQESRDGS